MVALQQNDGYNHRAALRPPPQPSSGLDRALAQLIKLRFFSDILPDDAQGRAVLQILAEEKAAAIRLPEAVHGLINARAPWLHPYEAIALAYSVCVSPVPRTPQQLAIALGVTRWEWRRLRDRRVFPEPYGPDPLSPSAVIAARRAAAKAAAPAICPPPAAAPRRGPDE